MYLHCGYGHTPHISAEREVQRGVLVVSEETGRVFWDASAYERRYTLWRLTGINSNSNGVAPPGDVCDELQRTNKKEASDD